MYENYRLCRLWGQEEETMLLIKSRCEELEQTNKAKEQLVNEKRTAWNLSEWLRPEERKQLYIREKPRLYVVY